MRLPLGGVSGLGQRLVLPDPAELGSEHSLSTRNVPAGTLGLNSACGSALNASINPTVDILVECWAPRTQLWAEAAISSQLAQRCIDWSPAAYAIDAASPTSLLTDGPLLHAVAAAPSSMRQGVVVPLQSRNPRREALPRRPEEALPRLCRDRRPREPVLQSQDGRLGQPRF